MRNYLLVVLSGIVVSVSTTLGVDPEHELLELTSGSSPTSVEYYYGDLNEEYLDYLESDDVLSETDQELTYSVNEIEKSQESWD